MGEGCKTWIGGRPGAGSAAPVPEAVTTAPIGITSAGKRRWVNSISHTSSSVLAWAATILQQSITDPPP